MGVKWEYQLHFFQVSERERVAVELCYSIDERKNCITTSQQEYRTGGWFTVNCKKQYFEMGL